MSAMCREQHIDPDLFDLFLTSRVWERYAHRFLQPAQIDEVDPRRFASRPEPPAPH